MDGLKRHTQKLKIKPKHLRKKDNVTGRILDLRKRKEKRDKNKTEDRKTERRVRKRLKEGEEKEAGYIYETNHLSMRQGKNLSEIEFSVCSA